MIELVLRKLHIYRNPTPSLIYIFEFFQVSIVVVTRFCTRMFYGNQIPPSILKKEVNLHFTLAWFVIFIRCEIHLSVHVARVHVLIHIEQNKHSLILSIDKGRLFTRTTEFLYFSVFEKQCENQVQWPVYMNLSFESTDKPGAYAVTEQSFYRGR